MLVEESIWFRERLSYLIAEHASAVVNIGSSTKLFREVIQPHLYLNIFQPLEQAGVQVIHLDRKTDVGVDIVGNLQDIDFIATLKKMKYAGIFCNNLLMHLELKERQELIKSIDSILPSRGYLFLSTSYNYPYCPDPNDSFYRPNNLGLELLFPNYEVLESAVVNGHGSLYKDMTANKKYGLILTLRLVLPFYKFRSWKFLIRYLPNLFKPYSASCVVLRKN